MAIIVNVKLAETQKISLGTNVVIIKLDEILTPLLKEDSRVCIEKVLNKQLHLGQKSLNKSMKNWFG
jgi:hypothetical protein